MANTNEKRLVIYTAIFGKKDRLITPRVVPPNCDVICFTDLPLRSSVWQVRRVARPLPDATRSARMYKLLPHKFLPEYDIALWVDGNMLIKSDIRPLIEIYLDTAHHLAVYSMDQQMNDKRDCVYDELEQLFALNKQGKYQDESAVMQAQVDGYRSAGYPAHNGLAWTCVLLRMHNEPDVIAFDEAWWQELSTKSKRDQLSFNYVAWKQGLQFRYIDGDATEDAYVKRLSHYIPWKRRPKNYLLGAMKRLRRMVG